MSNKNNIIDILNAINIINSSSKKKVANITTTQNSIPKFNINLSVPPDVDKLIREAEEYKKSSYLFSKTFITQDQSPQPQNDNVLILTDDLIDNSKDEDKNKLILELNNKIINLEQTEKKLLFQIDILKKNRIFQSKTESESENIEYEEPNSFVSSTKETLKLIYKQVEKQKQIFLDLENHSVKIERDSTLYKENYERLVVENHELKTKLKIAKEQIVNYESNKTNLLLALDSLNEILLKSNIVGKIVPQKPLVEKKDFKNLTKTETID